jgi:hypothetical protein
MKKKPMVVRSFRIDKETINILLKKYPGQDLNELFRQVLKELTQQDKCPRCGNKVTKDGQNE